MDNIVLTPKEDVKEEEPKPKEVEPKKELQPDKEIEIILRAQTAPKKKEYQKPTLTLQEATPSKALDSYEFEEEEYDDNDEYNSYNFEPEEDDFEEEIVEEIKDNPPLEEPVSNPEKEETFVVESTDQNSDTSLFDDTEVILPVLDMDSKEEVVVEEQVEKAPLENLENESYAKEFEPEDVEDFLEPEDLLDEPIAEPEYPDDSMKQMMETLVQLETNNQLPPEYMSPDYGVPQAMLPQPTNDPTSFMPLVPAGPLMDIPYESQRDVPVLEQNPYFRSRKMNFHLKPVILSLVSVIIFLGVFISIFAILHAFK
ncbi:MAG: hypothetical protein K2I88_06735 [Anaeroplasmataceae bacterium]|nr:hypothetical protein [Anaeroplasmataceae bacterium]